MASNGYAARAESVTKIFGEGGMRVVALDDISVQLQTGKFTAVMGPSGSGKSTLMHCLAGLDSINSGRVFIGDTDLTTLDDKALTFVRRDRVGFVFQAYNLIPTLTAMENIRLPLDLAGRPPDQQWLDTVIDTIGLRDRLDHRPSELSGGQQQRVACARAMVSRPDVIFADEPTGNLDTAKSHEIMALLKSLNETRRLTIVLVTHEEDIAAYAQRQVRFIDGRIASDTLRVAA
jgi:putative ABC transport system ATP-binding protein